MVVALQYSLHFVTFTITSFASITITVITGVIIISIDATNVITLAIVAAFVGIVVIALAIARSRQCSWRHSDLPLCSKIASKTQLASELLPSDISSASCACVASFARSLPARRSWFKACHWQNRQTCIRFWSLRGTTAPRKFSSSSTVETLESGVLMPRYPQYRLVHCRHCCHCCHCCCCCWSCPVLLLHQIDTSTAQQRRAKGQFLIDACNVWDEDEHLRLQVPKAPLYCNKTGGNWSITWWSSKRKNLCDTAKFAKSCVVLGTRFD